MWEEVHTYQEKSLDWFCVTVEVAFGYGINNGSFNFKYIQIPFFVLKTCDKSVLEKIKLGKKQKTNLKVMLLIPPIWFSGVNIHEGTSTSFVHDNTKNHLPTLGYTNILRKSSLFSLVNTISCEW